MSSEKPKICHLTTVHPPFDTRIFHKEAKSLAKAGYLVTLIAKHDKEETIDGVKILPLKTPRNRIVRMTKTLLECYRKAVKVDADLYHLHDPELIIVGWLLERRGKKVIYDVHEDYVTSIKQKNYLPSFVRNPLAKIIGLIEKVSSKLFDVIIAEKYYKERFNQGVMVLNYPVFDNINNDLHNNNKEHSITKIDLYKQNWGKLHWLIYTGSITEDRGAINHTNILNITNQVGVYFVGKCSEKLANKMLKIAEESRENLIIEGVGYYVSRETIDSRYKENNWLAGLALFPQTPHYYRKELTKIFEYMKNGIPILCSNFPAWKELIDETGCGIIVDPSNLIEIKEAIEWLIEHPKDRKEMGYRGRKAIEDKYNWSIEEKKLFALYEKIFTE